MKKSGAVDYDSGNLSAADQGCGRLRHLPIIRRFFDNIYLVDTQFQLGRRQILFGTHDISIPEYISTIKTGKKRVTVMSNQEFALSRLHLDVIFNICVFDVNIPKTRKDLISAAHRNLKRNGVFILIIPRNDQSILVRCTAENKYSDGHVFRHHGIYTFYRNYRETAQLIRYLSEYGFTLFADLSVYRQICLIFIKK